LGTGDTASTITGYVAQISLSSIAKPGVTYSVERASVDSLGVVDTDTYVAITLSKDSGTDTPLADGALTPDILGNLPLSYVYDRTIPLTDGAKYSYRVKAVKGADTQYKTASSQATVNVKTYIQGNIFVASKTVSASNSIYAITPSLTYKGALQTGDKLVLYWLTSNNSSAYQTGPYLEANKVEFTKDNLEAASIVAKNITIPTASLESYVFVQAYLVYADGTTQNVSQYSSYNLSFSWENANAYGYTGGISSVSGYSSSSGTYLYYAKLDYYY
jgi:hypothetical protein